MSIVTLKRKTQAQYNNNSVGFKNFSLNGTLRSQGYVGQTSLSRSLPRTLMNGPTLRGHGGCCGKYPMHPIIQSAVISLNDPTVIKPSVINTLGKINEELNCLTNINQSYFISCGPDSTSYKTVKPDNNQHLNNGGDYIKNLAKQTIQQADLSCNKHINNPKSNSCNKNTFFSKGPAYINHTKPESDYVPISQGEYLIQLDNSCNLLNKINIPNKNVNKAPLPGPGVSR
jgi:hypothetical protein